jgi:hypothetical protein
MKIYLYGPDTNGRQTVNQQVSAFRQLGRSGSRQLLSSLAPGYVAFLEVRRNTLLLGQITTQSFCSYAPDQQSSPRSPQV